MFQSLFCWMLFWKIDQRPRNFFYAVFQSLFCWMLFWKKSASSFRKLSEMVSILILLDVVLEAQRALQWGGPQLCFNPYSLDVVLEDSQGVLTPVFYPSFNPYSVGCCSGRGRLNRPLFVTG